MSLWADRVLPGLVDNACQSTTILAERRRWIPRAHGAVLELGVGAGRAGAPRLRYARASARPCRPAG
ncbi:MAG: hypothetical protein HS111_20790 [Kofleriaceae bacterium]|nr:hypothetical protein [Kofleriaceae bacterium]MCL4226633.1 hypothetical protein [Myxococcales bacterium]